MLSKKLSLLVLPFVAAMSLQAQNPFNDPFFNDPFGDDIFKEMLQMQKEMDQMFSRMQERRQQRSSGLVSPLGTYKIAVQNQFVDKGDVYELLTNIPESKENHIDVKTENGIMSVSAKIVQEQENKTKYSVSTSRSVQMYQQSTPLPKDADENSIKVGYKNGKLVITISKNKTAKSATVKATTPKVEKEIVKKAESSPKEVNKEVKKDPVKSNAVEITDEFTQTPKKETKEEKPVENKKTTVGDKESMI
jgi:HSP20 family molecular chaperone IbpA